MTEKAGQRAVPIPADQAGYLIATAARAPSVHKHSAVAVPGQPECDRAVSRPAPQAAGGPGRPGNAHQLRRRAVRAAAGGAVAGVSACRRTAPRPGPAAAAPPGENGRGGADDRPGTRDAGGNAPPAHPPWPVRPSPLPFGLLAGLQHDALAEDATLALVDRAIAYQKLADILGAVGRRQDFDPLAQAEVRRWSRDAADPAHDGVPAHAFPTGAGRQPGWLPQHRIRHYKQPGRTVWAGLTGSSSHPATGDQSRRASDPPKANPRRTHARIPDRRLTAPCCHEKTQVIATIGYSSPTG